MLTTVLVLFATATLTYDHGLTPLPWPLLGWSGVLVVDEWTPGDLNFDCDVDARDVAVFESCASGPGVPYPIRYPDGSVAACWFLDKFLGDADGDIDQVDFGRLQTLQGHQEQ